jgi:hypothetical protein
MAESSILEAEVQVNNIVKDIRSRVDAVYDRYTTDGKSVPKLPDFDTLRKNNRLHYDTSKKLTEFIDELIEVKLRVNVVRRHLEDMQKIQSTSRSDYTFMCNFKDNLKKYDEELSGYRFEIADLIKNANNKLRVLESVSFYDE